jgi:cytochrome c1
MNPTQYLTPQGLRALIRNPKAVRSWPQQLMPAFDAQRLSDTDLDAVIAYLQAMAGKP